MKCVIEQSLSLNNQMLILGWFKLTQKMVCSTEPSGRSSYKTVWKGQEIAEEYSAGDCTNHLSVIIYQVYEEVAVSVHTNSQTLAVAIAEICFQIRP